MTVEPEVDLEALRAFVRNIPLFRTLHYELLELKPGEVVIRAPYTPDHDGIFHSFHGGLLMTLADTTACAALLSRTGPEQVMTTTDMNIRFLAPCNSALSPRSPTCVWRRCRRAENYLPASSAQRRRSSSR
jgi:uncharacterized protein (TIGR00369 family)